MDEIKKKGLEKVIERHRNNVEKIQPIVTNMIEVGFDFTTEELKDLSSSCSKLHKQAEAMAKKEASRLKISFRRNADYVETLEHLNHAIKENAQSLSNVLLYRTQNPLEIEAYEVADGVVRLSSHWIEEKESEYTILPTERKEQAKRLVNDVRLAIENLNVFVADNRFIGKGISSWNDDRRCLCWIDGNGDFHEETENYEFI